MIKGISFEKRMICESGVVYQVADFCNRNGITRDKVIDIQYTSANDGTCRESAMLLYESE